MGQGNKNIKRNLGRNRENQSNRKLDKDRNTPDTPGFWGKTVNLTKRVAGGTADWITDGLTDFDKKGSSFGQWSPIGGGENKKWETKAEK